MLLDFGVQAQNVLSQGVIYALGRETTGRVTTAYVTSNFTGGAIGSAAGAVAWSAGGWLPVCAVGFAIAATAAARLADRAAPDAETPRATGPSGRRRPRLRRSLTRSAVPYAVRAKGTAEARPG